MKAKVHIAPTGQRLLTGLLALSALVTCFALKGTTASAAGCPNEAIREAQVSDTLPQGTTYLPNCMGLEMVSPPKKYNQYAEAPNFSASGERIKFISLAALAETPRLGSIFDPYVASRTDTGWVTEATTGSPEIATGSGAFAIPCTFSTDLSHWAFFGSTSIQAPVGMVTAFRGELGGVFGPMGPTMVPLALNSQFTNNTIANSSCEGASADLSHFFFIIKGTAYLPGDPGTPFSPAHVYEVSSEEGTPAVALLGRDKDDVVHGGACGATIGGIGNPQYLRGSVSPDASRVYFTTRAGQTGGEGCDSTNKNRIMVRQQTPAGPVIAELIANECTRVSPACSALDADDSYLGASQEGTRVFFKTPRQLTDTDKDETVDLYLHDASLPAGERLTQVSAGDDTSPTPGEGAELLGLSDFSGDGSRAYFVAKGVLTTANQAGDEAQEGEPNLYLYQRDATYPAGRTVFIATLAANDGPVWSAGSAGDGNEALAVPRFGPDVEDGEVGGDGHLLVFRSRAALATGDADGDKADIYRYDSDSGEIELITAAEPGGEDNGAIDVQLPGFFVIDVGPMRSSFNRWVSEGAETIVFTTAEKLDPDDQDEAKDPYLWREGSLSVLPSPGLKEAFPKVSLSGEEVIFITDDRLLPEDQDGATDAYVARANGGFPIPPPPLICTGEACQGAPSPQPSAVAPTSETIRQGNVKQPSCRKGFARKRGRCVKKAKKQRKQSKANRKQGGRK